jgi:hypothetical protein
MLMEGEKRDGSGERTYSEEEGWKLTENTDLSELHAVHARVRPHYSSPLYLPYSTRSNNSSA